MTSSSAMEEKKCLKDGGRQGGRPLTQKTGFQLRTENLETSVIAGCFKISKRGFYHCLELVKRSGED